MSRFDHLRLSDVLGQLSNLGRNLIEISFVFSNALFQIVLLNFELGRIVRRAAGRIGLRFKD